MAVWEFTFDGVTFGDGTDIDVAEVTGLEDLPDIRRADRPRARAAGRWANPHYPDERIVTFRLEMAEEDPDALGVLLGQIDSMTVPRDDASPLGFHFDGRPEQVVFARPLRRQIPTDLRRLFGAAVATVQFVAADPLKYSATETSDSTGVGSVSGGLGFPHGFPHGFGSATAGTIAVQNDGTVDAPWTATLDGPLTSPSITLVGTTGALALNGFSLAAGESLEIDSAERTVMLNGTASRYSSLTSRTWFDLPPGASLVQLGAAAGTGTLTLRYRSAWL